VARRKTGGGGGLDGTADAAQIEKRASVDTVKGGRPGVGGCKTTHFVERREKKVYEGEGHFTS